MPAARCPVLIGRTRELAALRSGLAAAQGGRGAAVAVLGAAGMGKTRLLRELGVEGRSAGVRTLVGRAVEAGTSTAFRPLTEALLAALRHDRTGLDGDQRLVPFRPVLGRLVPYWRVDDTPGDPSLVVLAEGILQLLRALAGEQGLVLALDDLHWADPETLAIVEYLADNLAAEPVLLVWAARDESGPAVTLAAVLAARGSSVIELGPLGDAEVVAMSAACMDHEPSTGLLEVLHRRAAGTPLLVEELLGTDGAYAETLVPASVSELVGRRTAVLSSGAFECVRYAAVLGPAFDWTLLPPLVGVNRGDVVLALREAAEAGLLDSTSTGFRFPHVLVRDAVLAAMLPPERAAAAALALTAVRTEHPELDAPWDEVAADLALLAGDSVAAARVLLAAGRRDLLRGALATAEATLGRAAELATINRQLAYEVDNSLTEVLALAGKTQAAAAITTRLITRLDQQVDAGRLAAAHLRMARVRGTAGDWTAARRETAKARQWAEQVADLPLIARVDTAAAYIALAEARFDEAYGWAQAGLVSAESLNDIDTVCEALEVLGRLARRENLGAAEALFERARVLAECGGRPVRAAAALHELSTLDAQDSLRFDRLENARQRALMVGALGTVAVVDLHLTAVALMRWDLDLAGAFGWRSVARARQLRLAILPKALVLAGLTDVVRGQPDGGEPAFVEALQLTRDDPHLPGEVWGARAHQSLLAADHDRARAQLERAVAVGSGEVIASPHVGMWLLMSAAVTGAVGPLPDGITVARWNRAYLRFAQAMVLGRAGHAEKALAVFIEADEEMRKPVDVRWHRRHARRVVAEAALADGWGDPVGWLSEDLPYFEALGHRSIASACRGLLRRAGVPVPRRGRHASTVPEELRRLTITAREHEVLQLVAEGMANRGIAERLVLSPRTVEKHVERLLAKTGRNTRNELVAFAAQATAQIGRSSGRAEPLW